MLGLTGSGKSTYSKKLAEQLSIRRFDFDLEYAKFGGNLEDHRWDESIALNTYELMTQWMQECIKQNESVILDYCPWSKDERSKYRQLIESLGATCRIYYFDVEPNEIWKRLNKRNISENDSQYVTREMLDDFVLRFDAPVDEDVVLIKV